MSWIVCGLIGGVAATAVGSLALRTQKRAHADEDGWKSLRPGWYLHFLVLGCLGFAGAIGYFFWLGGSARTDAAEQNLVALCLLLAFGAAGIWVYLTAYVRKIEWAGGVVRIRSPWRPQVSYRLSEAVAIRDSLNGAECKIRFADGRSLSVNMYFDGFYDFMADLDEASARR